MAGDGETLARALDEFSLDDLAAKPGRFQELAAELLVAREDRAAKAERDRLAAEADEALAFDTADWNDPAFLDGLRSQVLADRSVALTAYLGTRLRELSETWGAETAREMMANERSALATVDTFTGQSDPLYDHPAYRKHEQTTALGARSAAYADIRASGADFGAGEAEAYIAAALNEARGGAD